MRIDSCVREHNGSFTLSDLDEWFTGFGWQRREGRARPGWAVPGWAGPAAAGPSCRSLPPHTQREGGRVGPLHLMSHNKSPDSYKRKEDTCDTPETRHGWVKSTSDRCCLVMEAKNREGAAASTLENKRINTQIKQERNPDNFSGMEVCSSSKYYWAKRAETWGKFIYQHITCF